VFKLEKKKLSPRIEKRKNIGCQLWILKIFSPWDKVAPDPSGEVFDKLAKYLFIIDA